MATGTSGTVATTVTDVTTLMEHAFRRCGKMPSTISGEQQVGARENLDFILASLPNEGINLWCLQDVYIPLAQGQPAYPLPAGTADVLNANFRTDNILASTIVGYGNNTGYPAAGPGYGWRVTLDLGSAQLVTALKFVLDPAVYSATLAPYRVYELWSASAPDTRTVKVGAVVVYPTSTGATTYLQLDLELESQYWVLVDNNESVSSASMGLTSVELRSGSTDIPMSPYNKDDYFGLPNKSFQASRTLQYWFEKVMAPRVTVWPVPNAGSAVMVLKIHRQPQDVGPLSGQGLEALSNTVVTLVLEVPQRWYEYIIFALACKVALELPANELPPGRLEYLESKREAELNKASDGESDGAPFRVQPNLRGYTRG